MHFITNIKVTNTKETQQGNLLGHSGDVGPSLMRGETGLRNAICPAAVWWVGNEPIFRVLVPPTLSMSNGNVLHKAC